MRRFWRKIPRQLRFALDALLALALLTAAYAALGCPILGETALFRRAEKANLMGPSKIIDRLDVPKDWPTVSWDRLLIGDDGEEIMLWLHYQGAGSGTFLRMKKTDGLLMLEDTYLRFFEEVVEVNEEINVLSVKQHIDAFCGRDFGGDILEKQVGKIVEGVLDVIVLLMEGVLLVGGGLGSLLFRENLPQIGENHLLFVAKMFFHLFAEFGVEVGDEGDVFLVHGGQLHVEVLLNMGQFVL